MNPAWVEVEKIIAKRSVPDKASVAAVAQRHLSAGAGGARRRAAAAKAAAALAAMRRQKERHKATRWLTRTHRLRDSPPAPAVLPQKDRRLAHESLTRASRSTKYTAEDKGWIALAAAGG